ncbi:MAG TPA: hypothetical protein VH684_02865 [Xanthobacteraceae bacterium]
MRTVIAALAGLAFRVSHAFAQQTEPHGWPNNETLKTPYGSFEFENGYPGGDSASRLLGWFPIFRFYSPTEAYFDKTWALNDIEPVR